MTLHEQFLEILDMAIARYGNARRLANAMGMNPNLITRWKKKIFVPALDTIQPIIDTMGYKFADTVDGTGDCAGVRQQLAEANERIAALERELFQAQGEIRSLQGICDKALGMLAQKQSAPHAIAQGKSYALPESSTGENVG